MPNLGLEESIMNLNLNTDLNPSLIPLRSTRPQRAGFDHALGVLELTEAKFGRGWVLTPTEDEYDEQLVVAHKTESGALGATISMRRSEVSSVDTRELRFHVSKQEGLVVLPRTGGPASKYFRRVYWTDSLAFAFLASNGIDDAVLVGDALSGLELWGMINASGREDLLYAASHVFVTAARQDGKPRQLRKATADFKRLLFREGRHVESRVHRLPNWHPTSLGEIRRSRAELVPVRALGRAA